MDKNQLIELVTREVMKRIMELEDQKQKETLLIVSSNQAQIDKLKAKLGDDYQIKVSSSLPECAAGYDHMVIGQTPEKELICTKEENKPKQVKSLKIDDRLITESKLRKFQINGVKEIIIGRKCILTPLAKDFVREQRIKIKKIGEEE